VSVGSGLRPLQCHAKEYARARRDPIHLPAKGLFLARVRRHPHQLSIRLFQANSELEGVPQIFVHDQEIRPSIAVLEFADEKTSRYRRTHIPLRHLDSLDQLALAKPRALLRRIGIVIHAGAVQADDRRCKRVNLIVDPAKHFPRYGSIPELINRRQAVIADLRREVCEVLNAASAVRQRCVNLQVKGGVGGSM
jgi:hypothetical protein